MARKEEKEFDPENESVAVKEILADGIPVRCAYTKLEKTASLKPNKRNPNKHPDSQLQILARNIRRYGWRNPIVVSSRSGLIVAGHARYTAARILDVAEVPVDIQDYASDQDEMAVLIADNRIAELSKMDNDMLGELLSEMNAADYDMGDMGFDDKFFEKMFKDETTELEDPDIELVS